MSASSPSDTGSTVTGAASTASRSRFAHGQRSATERWRTCIPSCSYRWIAGAFVVDPGGDRGGRAMLVAMGTAPLTEADRAAFRAATRRLAPLADADLEAVEAHARLRRLARGEPFLAAGELAVECGTALAGLIREYFLLDDGREVTRGFAGPGDSVGSLSDLLLATPARSTVVAEAASRIVVIPWLRLRAIADHRPAWAHLIARLTERLYLAKAAREYELLALDAEARYLRFRARYATLEPAIALRQVASYVGITPEHLSRLRRRLAGAPARSPARTRPRTRPTGQSSRPPAAPLARRTATRPAPASRR
jgi:CRP-like cAMP-binding protein